MNLSNRKPFQSWSKRDPTYNYPSNQGYYRDNSDAEETLHQSNDADLQDQILSALMACAKINSEQIQVLVQNGNVELRGTVPTREMRIISEEVVQDIPSIQNLDNLLMVERSTSH